MSRKNEWYQGTDIELFIRYKNSDDTYKNLITEFDDIIVWTFTTKDKIIKASLSSPRPTGYYEITQPDEDDDTTLLVTIPSVETKVMKEGVVQMQINFVKNSTNPNLVDDKLNEIAISPNAGTLLPSLIKETS